MDSISELVERAEGGDSIAQLSLAEAYRFGRGTPQNQEQAIKWYIKAAEQGNVEAQASLGTLFEYSGQDKEAVRWYRLAAEQGHSDAQLGLGLAYEEGRGVSQDYKKAAEWFQKAVDGENDLAKMNLAFAYHLGQGVPQDFDKAEELYLEYLGYGESESGFVESQLGDLYRDSRFERRDDAQALEYLKVAARRGFDDEQTVSVCLQISEIYEQGEGVERDYVSAYMYCEIARSIDDKRAQERCAALRGFMTPKQVAAAQELAVEWIDADYRWV